MTSSLLSKTVRDAAASLFASRRESRHPATRPSRSRRAALETLEHRHLLSLDGWSFAVGGPGEDWGWEVATDADGNLYVTGQFNDTVDFDPGPGFTNLTSRGGFDTFAAKYNSAGALLWARSIDPSIGLGQTATAIALDASGNATVTISQKGFWHLNAAGDTLWTHTLVSTDRVEARDVAVDALGDIYIAGLFTETTDFGDTAAGQTISLTSAGGSDIFVAKYAESGEIIWAQRAGSPATQQSIGFDWATGITVGGDGSIYLTGQARDGAEFGGQTISLPQTKKGKAKDTGLNVFVAKIDAAGTFEWATMAGGTGSDDARDITTDGNGNVYITGNFRSSPAAFGGFTINTSGDFDVFAAKLDPSGNFLWARAMGGSNREVGISISADDGGNVYVAGDFTAAGSYGPFQLSSNGPTSVGGFVTKLDAVGGSVLSAQTIGWGASAFIGSGGALYSTGALKSDATGELFPTGETLASTPQADGSPSSDIFISKMEPGKPTVRRLSVSSDSVIQGGALTLSADGVLDIGGRVASVAFYLDANSDGIPDAGELLGTDSDVSDAWGISVSTTALAVDTHTFLAVATDNDGVTSDTVSVTVEVVEAPPASASDIYASDIQFETRLRGKGGSKHDERIIVTVRNDADANGADGGDPVVAGVSVTVEVTNSVGHTVTLSGTTNSAGVFTSGWLSNVADDTYAVTLTALTSSAPLNWNTSLGVVTTSHTVPHAAAASAVVVAVQPANDRPTLQRRAVDAALSSGGELSVRQIRRSRAVRVLRQTSDAWATETAEMLTSIRSATPLQTAARSARRSFRIQVVELDALNEVFRR